MGLIAGLAGWLKPRLLIVGAAVALVAVAIGGVFMWGRRSGTAARLEETIRDQQDTIRTQRDMAKAAAAAPRSRRDVIDRLRDGRG